jgi:hypothetical protein
VCGGIDQNLCENRIVPMSKNSRTISPEKITDTFPMAAQALSLPTSQQHAC